MRKTKVVGSLLVAAVCATIGCNPGISPEGTAILREGTRVEVFRVAPEPTRSPTDRPKIGRYPVLTQGKDLGSDFAVRLAAAVNGHPELDKKCGIHPGVAFRVWRGDQCVEVLVCFQCDVLAIHPGTGTGPATCSLQTQIHAASACRRMQVSRIPREVDIPT
jgi:hypothetical protein